MLRSSSPGARTVLHVPCDEVGHGTVRLPPSGPRMVATPSSPAQSEVMGPAGSAVQMLPPTVDMFQTLKEATNESQQGRIKVQAGPVTAGRSGGSRGRQRIQLRDSAGCGEFDALRP